MAESVKYRKVYVGVELSVSPQGDVRPRTIIFEDGNKYQIDRLRQKCRAHATKVGGTGIRYTVIICNKETYLYEDDGRWFVEAKDIGG
ncbi:MAG: hypothetical protein ACOYJS_00485 [Acutalibacteraceae bacterium]|jgi:hypothetical protein